MTETFAPNNTLVGEELVCLSDMLVYRWETWAIAGLFCWAAVAIALWNMYRHFDNYVEPKYQVNTTPYYICECVLTHASLA